MMNAKPTRAMNNVSTTIGKKQEGALDALVSIHHLSFRIHHSRSITAPR
jgi:hypothetical protein